MLEVTAGAVFHDGLGELTRVRDSLRWYPHEVWVWVLAAQWRRIDQEEPFVGRTAEVDDELGSRMIASRLVREIVRLCFLLERRYAPYSKWLGSAFRSLDAHADVRAALDAALDARTYAERERALNAAVERVAERHNDLGVTERVDPSVRPFYSRPFRVLGAGRFVEACLEQVSDPSLRSLPLVGAIDQFADSTDILSYPASARRLRAMYETG